MRVTGVMRVIVSEGGVRGSDEEVDMSMIDVIDASQYISEVTEDTAL